MTGHATRRPRRGPSTRTTAVVAACLLGSGAAYLFVSYPFITVFLAPGDPDPAWFRPLGWVALCCMLLGLSGFGWLAVRALVGRLRRR